MFGTSRFGHFFKKECSKNKGRLNSHSFSTLPNSERVNFSELEHPRSPEGWESVGWLPGNVCLRVPEADGRVVS